MSEVDAASTQGVGCQRNEKTGRYDPPSDSTFRRALMRVEASALASIVGGWLGGQEIGVAAVESLSCGPDGGSDSGVCRLRSVEEQSALGEQLMVENALARANILALEIDGINGS